MKENSRIRFNPVTKEIEVAGSESFVKTYFSKLQAMISGSPKKVVVVKERPIKVKVAAPKKSKVPKVKPFKKTKSAKTTAGKKVKKVTTKEPGKKKVTNIEAVVSLIQASAEGISTAELKRKTGLAESQIWNIVTRATKEGRIQKIRRGAYCATETFKAAD